ncbi:putative UDP-N-acetylglucosamine--peptide N-acetylglucosaminyltransferase SPINDLY [Hibiscus syriacus]|uniref:protein O-GlcNAc transferase n=1 Tax=Hibiscus syriacus TaxID=106335 RepID=A0A6A2YRH7_HIBSY|nr:putative UDP-N-acetylglucosamine--peptide N-acetylglucosaminyltransferase SPINDLY [Hibiscus syriacus]
MSRSENDANEREGDLAVENGFVKESQSSPCSSVSTADAIPAQKASEGKDSLSYANILRSRNKFADALSLYNRVLEKDSGCVEAYIGKGICLQMQNMGRAAFESFTEAIKLDPQNACALTHCGILYNYEGRLVEAAESYQKALSADPSYKPAAECLAIVLTDLGTSLKLAGNTQEGIQKYYEALKIDPHYAHYHSFIQPAYYNLGDINQGVAYYKKALSYNWHYADAMYNLGVAYGEMLKFNMVFITCYNIFLQLALSIKPNFSQSLNNLGVVYTVQGKMDAAASMIEKAIIACPTYAEAYNNLGVLYRDAGNISMAITAYEQCLKIDPDSRNAGQNRLLAMNYINEGDDKLFDAHRDWGRRFMRLYPQYNSWDKPKDPERPLVIGYISSDYFTHSVSYFIEGPLIYHDYGNYQVVVYSAVVKADAKTIRFRERVMKKGGLWRDIYGVDEKKVASMVREDKIDILVELTGHTANNKLGTMACRPAPVQVTWIGYPNTTGLPTIDYRITDSFADPPDTKQKHVEELVRLPECFLCYTPSLEAGRVSPTPALANGFITFGSFNNLAKITPKVLRVWARILCAVPNSRLVVKCKPFCCDSVRQKFLTTLEQLGLESLRVDLLPLILLNHDHMQAYSLMDISLDTFPYAGMATTCEFLYMGVPCVTMAGSVHAHNVGVSILSKVGLQHLIAKNEDEYVQLALQLASDVTALQDLRMSLRDLMSKSPICDGQNFISGLEATYRNMWCRYCKGDVPSLRYMEMLEKQDAADGLAVKTVEPEKVTISTDTSPGAVKSNGFNQVPLPTLNLTTSEENGNLLHQATNPGKLS